MEPRYSILLCNESLTEYEKNIERWLAEGVKVLWFGRGDDAKILNSKYSDFIKAFILQVYVTNVGENGIIIDGEDETGLFEKIADDCPGFNSAQYKVEHCRQDAHIVVQASAGTGKTTVMMDRIMYLLHTVPELRLNDIYMITFTNEAAQQMNRRLQNVFLTRFTLTKQKKYLRWLEEQSQMHISTIHHFALDMLKKLGIGEGFTKRLSIRTFEYQKNELIKDVIDERIDEKKKIREQLGMQLQDACSTSNSYWEKILQLGISHRDLLEMDFGEAADRNSQGFHELIKGAMHELDEAYFEVKRKEEGISTNDIMRDLQEILLRGNFPEADIDMKYLYIDEFQDSDLSQIKVACLLGKLKGTRLFVVGDAKQSIYRFRGATDRAFSMFDLTMEEMGLGKAEKFILINNYRTTGDVLLKMDKYFQRWAAQGYLNYDKPVIPFNEKNGRLEMIMAKDGNRNLQLITDVVNRELKALEQKLKESEKEPDEKNRVVILTKNNKQLSELAILLGKAKIPASVKRDGAFFKSEAVRDFYYMVSSFMFCDEPKYIFNYLLTPYAGDIEPMDINVMERLNGDYDDLVEYLDHFLNQTTWKKYHKALRLRPVMSVLKDMLDSEKIVDKFIALNKRKRKEEGWTESRTNTDTAARARQYRANLEKLMDLLQKNLGNDKVSLYTVFNYLRINVATNRTEEEANVQIQTKDDYKSVLCMTVHKSKGLEFDTVIIPYTKVGTWTRPVTELLVDPIGKKIGWNYMIRKGNSKYGTQDIVIKNQYYDELKKEDVESNQLEGVRVLYVGMTRAIENLICIVEKSSFPMSWGNLLDGMSEDNE